MIGRAQGVGRSAIIGASGRRASSAVGHSGHLSAGTSLSALRNAHDTPAHAAGISLKEAYLFDLNGYIVVKNAFAPEMVERANAAIDAHADRMRERVGQLRTSALYGRESTALKGDGSTGRKDLGGMLGWAAPHCNPFRELLCHPRVALLLTELLGVGYRLDHSPLLISQEEGAEGHTLHGGAVAAV